MLKLLIANQQLSFAKGISVQLRGKCEIKICKDGYKTLDYCREFKPDVLVLDLEMQGMDGLSIARAIRNAGLNIDILAITVCADSVYAQRQLVQLGVEYILPKPCTVAATSARIYEMLLLRDGKTWSVEEEADALMLSLGMRMNLSGYTCVREAILMMLQDRNIQITKVIYPELAAKFGGTSKRVERVIRCAIEDAWKRRDERMWRMYFKPDREGEVDCPTNGYFISRLSMCIDRRKIV